MVSVLILNVYSNTSNTCWESSEILLMKDHFRANAVNWGVKAVRLSWIPFGYLLFRHFITILTGISNTLACLYYIQWISISHTGAKSKVKEYPTCQSLSEYRFNWGGWGLKTIPVDFGQLFLVVWRGSQRDAVYWACFKTDASIRCESVIWFSANTGRMPDSASLSGQVEWDTAPFKKYWTSNHAKLLMNLYGFMHFNLQDLILYALELPK